MRLDTLCNISDTIQSALCFIFVKKKKAKESQAKELNGISKCEKKWSQVGVRNVYNFVDFIVLCYLTKPCMSSIFFKSTPLYLPFTMDGKNRFRIY